MRPRDDIHERATKKSTSAANRLRKHLDSSDHKGRPIGYDWRDDDAEKGKDAKGRLKFPTVPVDEEFLRLKRWLLEFVAAGDVESYAALLQVWLVAHGIPWLPGIFPDKLDFSLPPKSGRPRKSDEFAVEARDKRAQGRKWIDQAREKSSPEDLQREARYSLAKQDMKKKADRIRKAASRYRPGIYQTLQRLGHEMLGTPLPADLQDHLREIVGETDTEA